MTEPAQLSIEQQEQQRQQERERLLREAAENEARNRQALAMAIATGRADPRELQRYDDSVKDTTAKLAHIDKINQDQQRIQKHIDIHLKPYLDQEFVRSQGIEVDQGEVQKAIEANEQTIKHLEDNKGVLYGKASPYIDMNKGTIDVAGAIKSGVSDKELRDAGISQIDIVKTRRDITSQDLHKKVDAKVREIQSEQVGIKPASLSHAEASAIQAHQETAESKGIPDYSGTVALNEYLKNSTVKAPSKPYLEAEAELDKKAAEIWGRKELTPDAKARLLSESAEWTQYHAALDKESGTLTSKVAGASIGMIAIEMLVPVVYTAKHWNDMSAAGKALSIAIDVASLIPFAGSVIRGARAGATFGRTAMARNMIRAIGQESIAQVAAPVTMIMNPIKTAKAAGKQLLNVTENIANLKKVPYTVLSTTDGTVRIKITKGMTQAEAIAAGDILMEKAISGQRIIMQAGDDVIEVATSPFMREARKTGNAAVHGTPFGEDFAAGIIKADATKGGDIYFSHEPLTRFTLQNSRGQRGTMPILYVANQETAKQFASSNKLWHGTRELEKVLPVGASTAGAKQRLLTRIGPNADKVVMLLENPIPYHRIVKLKLETFVESVKAPFTLAIKQSEKVDDVFRTMGKAQVDDMARLMRETGNIDQARAFVNAYRVVASVKSSVTPRLLSTSPALRNVNTAEISRARAKLEREARITEPTKTVRARVSPQTDRVPLVNIEDGRAVARARTVESRTIETADITPRVTDSRVMTSDEPRRVDASEPERRFKRPDNIERPPRLTDTPERRFKRSDDDFPPPPPPRIHVPPPDKPEKSASRMTDEEKRQYIRDKAFTAQNMGKLHGKDVWHIFMDNGEKVVLLGDPPAGVRITADGAGSARATTQRVGKGKTFRPITHQHGAVITHISPTGKTGAKADFVPNLRVKPSTRKAESISSPSVKRGRQYFTNMGKTTAISRKPIRRKR